MAVSLVHPGARLVCDRPCVMKPVHASFLHTLPMVFGADVAAHLRPFSLDVILPNPLFNSHRTHAVGVPQPASVAWHCHGAFPSFRAPASLVSRLKQRDRTFTFINGRPVHDEVLNTQITRWYRWASADADTVT